MTTRRGTLRGLRRGIATVLPLVLTATALSLIAPTAAWAGEPSVPLPSTTSTPVSQQTMGTRQQDDASAHELHGNQPSTTGAKDGGGTNKATPLSPSATWDVSAQTGDFSWSYPLRVPPSAGGLDPDLSLNYASSAVDGRTSATNNQASWVGDGWDLSVGFIERTYIPCAGDTTPTAVGDLCWRSDNAVASYAGGGGQLIRDDATGTWRNKTDDGSRIERLTGAANGDNDGEYWRITTADGTQYLFGDRPDAKSAWTVPVFGNDTGEPCHASTFGASHCTQAWRWNLDKVIDRHGNVIQYTYDTETNSYGMDNKDTAVSYIRGGTLKGAEYGLRDGGGQQATARVNFTTADRCVPGSDCTPDKKDNWPDVSWDSKCDTPTCADKHAPTFWSTKRLSKVTTQVLGGSAYDDVESWSLDQGFPVNGDGEKAALWLKAVTHTGLVGGTPATLPPVRFEGTKFANRVDKVEDGIGPLLRYRITGVISETGGVTTITYAPPDCTATDLPAKAETNTKRCFPMKWAKKDFSERTDYFNKYVVAQVTQSDMIAANTEDVTGYEYLDGAAWAYETSEFTKDTDRQWNDFRGFGRVRITKGKTDDPSGPVTMTEARFYRGMDGDKQPTGTRSVSVSDSEGGVHKDEPWLQGFQYENQTHNGTGQEIVSKTITTPLVQGPTATRGILKAYTVKPGTIVNYTALSAGGWRTTRTEQSYDDLGQPTMINDLGDTSTGADDTCTRTKYVRNTSTWLVASPSQSETVSVACTATPKYPDDAMSGTRYSYDGKVFGAAPATGDTTKVEVLDKYPASGAVYLTDSTSAYDALGRVTSAGDALGRTTTTGYTPATGGPLLRAVVTNAAGQATTTTVEPAFGQPVKVVDANDRVTETAYDALGNRTEIWLPNRARSPGVGGSQKFSYAYHNDAPGVVTTTKIGPNGNYTTSTDLYDGLLRLRQTQVPASGGGRLIIDTRYDSQGRQFKLTKPYFNDAPVDDKLWIASDVDVPMQTNVLFDGAGRQTREIIKGGANELWHGTTTYGGDRATITPPDGSTASTAITDARGRVVEVHQYHGQVPSGDFDVTKYTYTPAGRLASTTDPAGNTWHRGYDLRGNEIKDEDVDKGTSIMTYDAANQLVTSTDARDTTLVHGYDDLGRPTSVRTGSPTGPVQAQWTYDTAPFGKGQPSTSTRYVNGDAYTSTVLGYNALTQPIATEITVPDSEKALSGTYTTYAKYNVDGSPSSTTYAAIGAMPAEAVQSAYNDLGQPTTTSGGFDGKTFNYVTDTQYTRYGEVARTQLGGTGKRVWLSQYYDDHTRRVNRTIVDAEVPAPMQSDTRYTHDQSGNITSIADIPQGKPADLQCFTLDHAQRITEAWTPGGSCDQAPTTAGLAGPAPYWQSFTYDKLGNRLTETQHSAGGNTVSTGTLSQTGHTLSAVSTTGPSGTTSGQYLYDNSGNTITRKLAGATQQLDWDAEGHLSKITEDGKVTDFVYDTGGTRLIRHDPTGSTLYLAGQELRLTKATGKLDATRYYRAGGATVAMRDGTGLTWLAGDLQNTSQIAISSTTLQVTQRRQTPFGESRGGAVNFPGEKGFVGGTVDSSTGLTELGARQYDPELGRFLSVDPKMDLTDPQQMQGYTYADNNPISKTDATGELWGWVEGVRNGLAKAYNTSYKWVDERKTLIGIGVLAVGMAFSPVGWVAAAAMIAGTALTVMDIKEQTDNRREHQQAGQGTLKEDILVAVDFASLGVGGASFAAGNLKDNAHDLALDLWPKNQKVSREVHAMADGSAFVSDVTTVAGVGTQTAGTAFDGCYRPEADTAMHCFQPPTSSKQCSSAGLCACVVPPRASTQVNSKPKINLDNRGRRGSIQPPRRTSSNNLGPDRPGPNSPRWGSPQSKEAGVYQTSDGLYHQNSGHGLAFF
jgi:RHS repeat-associated protein